MVQQFISILMIPRYTTTPTTPISNLDILKLNHLNDIYRQYMAISHPRHGMTIADSYMILNVTRQAGQLFCRLFSLLQGSLISGKRRRPKRWFWVILWASFMEDPHHRKTWENIGTEDNLLVGGLEHAYYFPIYWE